MSGGAGHLIDMMNRLRSNNGLLNKTRRNKVKEAYQKVSIKTKFKYKTATKEDIEKIRILVIKQRKKEINQSIIVMLITISIAPLIIYLFVKILDALLI